MTQAETQTVSRHLVANYKKEAELYASVLKLTQLQQANLSQSQEIRDFITLLHQKEDLIRSIDKVEIQLDADKAKWLAIPEKLRTGTDADLNGLLDDIILLIEKIMEIEQQNERLLRARKEDVERELEAVRKGRRAAKDKPKSDAKLISAVS